MDYEQLTSYIVESIASEVVNRVYDKLVAIQKKALVICTGSAISKTTWLVGLQQLKEAGFTFDLFLTKSAVDLLDPWVLESTLTPGHIFKSSTEESPETLARKYHTLIVPAMTIYTASKVASCMGDTPASRMIFDGLMRGKNVIVATDGCCPDFAARAALGYCPPEPLKQALRDNIAKIKSYGAVLTSAERLAEKTLSVVQNIGFTPSKPAAPVAQVSKPAPAKAEAPAKAAVSVQQNKPAQTQGRIYLDVRVLGNSDILAYPAGTVITVPSNCLVTQMALDTARGRQIVIEKQANANGR